MGALRDDRRKHLHVRLGLGAAPERGLRPEGRRHAEGVGLLGPLLRPDPHGHDQLRRHDQRLDARRAGVTSTTSGSPTASRGGPPIADGFFAPTTKTPYTDELQLRYEVDLGNNMSVSATYYNRRPATSSRTSIRAIYTDTVRCTAGQHQRSELAVPRLGLLRLRPEQSAGGELLPVHADGRQARLQRPRAGRSASDSRMRGRAWRPTTTSTRQGNAVSDGNADFAGDVFWLDPRAPNMEGTVAGTIHHLLQGWRFLHDQVGHRAWRRLSLELRAGRQHNAVRVEPASADSGPDDLRQQWRIGPVDCQWRDWRGSEPVLGAD